MRIFRTLLTILIPKILCWSLSIMIWDFASRIGLGDVKIDNDTAISDSLKVGSQPCEFL